MPFPFDGALLGFGFLYKSGAAGMTYKDVLISRKAGMPRVMPQIGRRAMDDVQGSTSFAGGMDAGSDWPVAQ